MNTIKHLSNNIRYIYYKKKTDDATKHMEKCVDDENWDDFVTYARIAADNLRTCLQLKYSLKG